MRLRLAFIAWAVATAFMGCGGEDPPTSPSSDCIENLNLGCSELLHSPPTYTKIYENILVKDCALGSNCHSADGAMGGLAITDAEHTYDTLLGAKGGVKRVIPYDPACSPLMKRLDSRDRDFGMPPGLRLTEPAQCVFIQWIKGGAPRN